MQILCVKNKRYLQFYPLWSFGGQFTPNYAIHCWAFTITLIMYVRMYDKGYVRLTALRRDAMPFFPTLRFATHWAELLRPFRAFTAGS